MYQMAVQFSLCDNNKNVVFQSEDKACFATMSRMLPEHLAKTVYFHYKPFRTYDTPYDKIYWDLVMNLWFFPEMLEGQTLKDCNKDGIYLDATKWDAWHLYCCLCAIRYMNEHENFAEQLVKVSDKYQLSTFHTFLLLHIVNAKGDYATPVYISGPEQLYWSYGHMLIAPVDCGVLEMIQPESFKEGEDFPNFGKPYVESPNYTTAPDKSFHSIHEVFKNALIKYGGGKNVGRTGKEIEYYPGGPQYKIPSWKNIDELLPIVFPSKCLANAA
jgi:hypothetical protein